MVGSRFLGCRTGWKPNCSAISRDPAFETHVTKDPANHVNPAELWGGGLGGVHFPDAKGL